MAQYGSTGQSLPGGHASTIRIGIGVPDEFPSRKDPYRADQIWRERLTRGYWDHAFHPMNEQVQYPSLRGAKTTSAESFATPWKLINRSHRVGIDDGGQHIVSDKTIRAPRTRSGTFREEGQNPLIVAGATRSLRGSRSTGALRTLPDGVDFALGNSGTTVVRSHNTLPREKTGVTRDVQGWSNVSGAHLRVGERSRTTMPSFARIYGK
mmetsp:Transcript_84579/g.149706  ORF Transcript_84579/g.149706 Transcript_84579/m.149706 type:complete len:209 (-) Transcript_84579:51-677(-)